MNSILCVDNSGSTADSTKYWYKVFKIYHEIQPYRLIYWNTAAEVKTNFLKHSTGGTKPQSFIELLQNETTPYNLFITTDGEISDSDIDQCGSLVTQKLLSFINSTTIYYIGSENCMNIGLNVIFGRTNKMSYQINEKSFEHLYDKFDKLELDEFMSPNFAISVIVKIKNTEAAYPNNSTREAKLSELRGEVCRLYSKLEHESLDSKFEDKLEKYYQNNQMKEFIDILAKDQLDVQSVSRQKCAILNLFDRKIDFNISRITASASIQEQIIEEVTPEEDSAWSEFEDVITLENFNLPCLLVQNTDEPLITDKILLKHPFKLLSEPDIIKKIMQLIEPNPIDYTTYKKLAFDYLGYTVSPYTRARCKGVFLLDIVDMKCVKNNCRVMSVLFGNENKVPGHLVLWNLVFMYLLYKCKFDDTPYKSVIFDQIIKYCKTFSTTLSFTHQCQVLRAAKIEICLWFCIHVAPRFCPNTAKNVLRSPFGLELLEFYLAIFEHDQDKYLLELSQRTRKWTVWNYLLVNKGRSNLDLEVKAQYQNYCIHKDCIILLTGKCETPFKSKCNILDADNLHTLFVNLTDNSAKVDNVDAFELVPACVDYTNEEGVAEEVSHVKINIKTCWPYVICPVTKVHWKECIGKYDIKTDSHLRLFNTYCCKYKIYPAHYMDLALLYSQRIKNCVLTKRVIDNFEYIYSLFQEVMKTYTCEEYISIYTNHTDENVRLSKE